MTPDLELVPREIKKMLEDMTMIEEMLISPVLPGMSIYRLPDGQNVSRGHMVNFSQEISINKSFTKNYKSTLPVITLKKINQKNESRHF